MVSEQDKRSFVEKTKYWLSVEKQLELADYEGDTRKFAKLPISALIVNYGYELVSQPIFTALQELILFFNATEITAAQMMQFVFLLKKENVLSIADISQFFGMLKISAIKKPAFGKITIPYLIENLSAFRLQVAEKKHNFDMLIKSNKNTNKGISYDEWADMRLSENPNFQINFGKRKNIF